MAYSGIALEVPIDFSGNFVSASKSSKINDADFYISDDSDEGAFGAENKSIFDMEISGVSPELIRIFNLTPPLNDVSATAVHSSTIVPYYITVYSPVNEGHKSLGIIEGSVPYPQLCERVSQETLKILVMYLKRVGLGEWKKKRHKSFDHIFNDYFVKKYTYCDPFIFHYFFNGEWRIFKFSLEMKREIFSAFLTHIRKITEVPNTT